MGIALSSAKILQQEGTTRPFSGTALTLGKQDIGFTYADIGDFSASAASDQETSFDDVTFFKCLGFDQVYSLDSSDYEGADFIHDLNTTRLDPKLESAADLVFDGGTLEHVFHLPNALSCIHRFLKVGGRFLHVSPASNCVDHGFYSFSPTVFADYFTANQYRIYWQYVCLFRDDPKIPWTVKKYPEEVPNIGRLGLFSDEIVFICGCFEKQAQSTGEVIPTQTFYENRWANPSPN